MSQEPGAAQPRAIALLGPTASGKTGLAIALAHQFNGEIISIDSALVYRGMDIGTAKPSMDERQGIVHHLIDIIDPIEAYSAARFRDDALRLAADIHARGKLPILAGGTMLYFKGLREGFDDLPQADAATRAGIDSAAHAQGWPALHAELATIDPATAQRLAPNDAQRIGRALEIFRLTGQPMSALLKQATRTPAPLPFKLLAISLEPSDRAVLHQRIAQRFGAMLAAGLLDEVRTLRSAWPALTSTSPSMRCVGYRQAWEYLDRHGDALVDGHTDGRSGGHIHTRRDYEAMREAGIAATRQLAKRQLTWLRSMPSLTRIDCLQTGLKAALEAILKPFIEEQET